MGLRLHRSPFTRIRISRFVSSPTAAGIPRSLVAITGAHRSPVVEFAHNNGR
jgi:hypothetical protein